jgi:hypothetical protein
VGNTVAGLMAGFRRGEVVNELYLELVAAAANAK